jgi:hypothetical protein
MRRSRVFRKGEGDLGLVVVVKRAEMLIQQLMVPLTRLAELVSSSLPLMS